ncbi:hypothetical protein LTR65_006269 [Meristemomyces frigidus]
MPSTLTSMTAYAAHALSILSVFAAISSAHAHSPSLLSHPAVRRGLATMTYEGCFSSSSGLTDQGSWIYQTSGYCQPICVDANQAVLATSKGSDCWCGDVLPPADSKVDDSSCNTTCNGYSTEDCGGDGFYSVYLSGTEASVSNYGGSDSSSSTTVGSSSTTAAASSTTTPPPPPAASTATEIVVTSVGPGHTVVVTMPASEATGSSSSTTTTADSKHSSSTNVAGVAAGAVVGVLAVAAIVAGLFFWLRHRRRQAVQDEYTRKNPTTDFFRSGGSDIKPPPSAYSNMSNSVLDPAAGRRNSFGSIADDQDYSRRILRVANPDGN